MTRWGSLYFVATESVEGTTLRQQLLRGRCTAFRNGKALLVNGRKGRLGAIGNSGTGNQQ